MNARYDIIIVGTGAAGLGAAFRLAGRGVSVLMLEKNAVCSGGLRNDCKQNYTYPVGFDAALWTREEADEMLALTAAVLDPPFDVMNDITKYQNRAAKVGAELIPVKQAHVGTDRSLALINSLMDRLRTDGVAIALNTAVETIDADARRVVLADGTSVEYRDIIIAPGRAGYEWLQNVMNAMGVRYHDNVVDIGLRLEMHEDNYAIVRDYYDPKFLLPGQVRTFCTNSRAAYVVREKYESYWSVNGHAFASADKRNGLVNFAMLNTIHLTDPVVSGHQFAVILGQAAMKLSGGKPMMQRVGDFRMGRRSKDESFVGDLYDFEPTLKDATPGDIALAAPARIMRSLWSAMKTLDTIVPGVLHPSTIMYYPEIKTYANRPEFLDGHFMVRDGVYMAGDGAGTSRGITGAWASGIRAADGILGKRS